ncbi:alcohol dehydrogenase [Crocosphaera subtropica ATCC 51142]|uniref:alcohol dehydrogenase n=2 Tax=Crocosphaera TaxID=263510 RepID=B1WYC4_CROS5|nr:alcohol dehydrogenase [Crocosphaera subtropica ATCC 51142]
MAMEVKQMMRAMVLEAAKEKLRLELRPIPEPDDKQLLLKIQACGVCRTDLHIVDGELTQAKFPLILGHEIVGTVEAVGKGVKRFSLGERVGVPWLGGTCQHCCYCRTQQENLCEKARFTGYHLDGGYAEYTVANEQFCFAIPKRYSDLEVAPLLCAGLIGYRSYRLVGDREKIGFYGFGAAAHILLQVARHQGRQVYAFTRPGDELGQDFARSLGAVWAGGSEQSPPDSLDGAIIFAPVGALVPVALKAVTPGGVVVCAGIHMSDIPSFPYKILWQERVLRSVANLTRQDGEDFFALAKQIPIQTQVSSFPLTEANVALDCLRQGKIKGAAVLVP